MVEIYGGRETENALGIQELEWEKFVESVDETTETVGSVSCSMLVLYMEFVRKWGGGNNQLTTWLRAGNVKNMLLGVCGVA